MSELNIDASLVKSNQLGITRTEEKLVEMSNGCICCTLREDLLVEIARLASEGRFDYLLIESTGISEPLPVAETFTFADEQGKCLSDISALDTMVTVVDGAAFIDNVNLSEDLLELGMASDENDTRTISDLLIDQVEFSNVIVINKCDQISSVALAKLKALLLKLNPDAIQLETSHGRVDPCEIMNTSRFDFQKASENPGWLKEIRGEHTPETEEYGITSFVFRDQRPFHPERLEKFLCEAQSKGILRAKGFCWLATRNEYMGMLAIAGQSCLLTGFGRWLATIPQEEWNLSREEMQEVAATWHPTYGDRQQEIVFIGVNLNTNVLIQELKSCLLNQEEMALNRHDWEALPDPFPEWVWEEESEKVEASEALQS
jgi:G3E family GTPase